MVGSEVSDEDAVVAAGSKVADEPQVIEDDAAERSSFDVVYKGEEQISEVTSTEVVLEQLDKTVDGLKIHITVTLFKAEAQSDLDLAKQRYTLLQLYDKHRPFEANGRLRSPGDTRDGCGKRWDEMVEEWNAGGRKGCQRTLKRNIKKIMAFFKNPVIQEGEEHSKMLAMRGFTQLVKDTIENERSVEGRRSSILPKPKREGDSKDGKKRNRVSTSSSAVKRKRSSENDLVRAVPTSTPFLPTDGQEGPLVGVPGGEGRVVRGETVMEGVMNLLQKLDQRLDAQPEVIGRVAGEGTPSLVEKFTEHLVRLERLIESSIETQNRLVEALLHSQRPASDPESIAAATTPVQQEVVPTPTGGRRTGRHQ